MHPALPCPASPSLGQGVFGMNLESGLEPYQPGVLWGIAGLGLATGCLLMLLFGGYAKRKGLLYLPSFGRD